MEGKKERNGEEERMQGGKEGGREGGRKARRHERKKEEGRIFITYTT